MLRQCSALHAPASPVSCSSAKKGTTLKLQFDKREFLRKPTDDVKITEEEIKTVVEEVTASISAGFLSFSASWKGIAAQFRNTVRA